MGICRREDAKRIGANLLVRSLPAKSWPACTFVNQFYLWLCSRLLSISAESFPDDTFGDFELSCVSLSRPSNPRIA
jgi:hypothetical protein